MTKETALDRIAKAEEFIAKKQNTIVKHEASMAKKQSQVEKILGTECPDHILHTVEMQEMGLSREDANTIYWLLCDIEHLGESIWQSKKAIAEKEEKLPEYRKALAEAEEVERILADEIPEALKAAKTEMVERWTQADIAERERMFKDRQELEWKEFTKKWTYSVRDSLSKTDEEFRKANEKDATMWMVDLYNRVKDITGNITDARYLRWGGKSLEGHIVGENGIADVTTIGAGGYNIQRFHLRVLVKAR